MKNNKCGYTSPPCYTTKGWVPRQLPNCYMTIQHCFIQNIQNMYLRPNFRAPASFPSCTCSTHGNIMIPNQKHPNCGKLASSPGHSQILSRSRFSPRLRDKIWEWPGDESSGKLLQIFSFHILLHFVFSVVCCNLSSLSNVQPCMSPTLVQVLSVAVAYFLLLTTFQTHPL